ncbi:hypothetical protein BDR05DRAFT_958719 [Suillus weaverae]|nr:hypothetical protein BDR05DRAFT_958719 [Suillus weaverae]
MTYHTAHILPVPSLTIMRFTALVALAIVMLNVHGLAVPAPSPTRVSSSDNPSPIRTKRVDLNLTRNYTSDRSDGRLANRTPATTVKRDTNVQLIGTAVNELSWYKGLVYKTLKRDTTFDSLQPIEVAVNDLASHPTPTAILKRDTTAQLIETITMLP